ncbi:ceramide synthase 2-like [Gigantopelta aegis]|uniref:ceramide synthase 2-like n=1 Tax=Gigantopelta aegis TaxID=1735272 RepID=UPI001B88ADE0|nr:ceramide synthase 2-like [Gigantopelta aegis]
MASDFLWSEKFWFQNGVTWKDLESHDPNVYYPKVNDINLSFIVGLIFIVIRYTNERFIIVPLGRYLGIKDRKAAVVADIPALESCFKLTKGKQKLTDDEMKRVCKQTDMTEREVERWFFKRRMKNSPTAMMRFRECSWHFIFYSISFTYGLIILWNKPWFSDTRYCWAGWPHQPVTNDLYYLYLMELSFYWSLIFTLVYDVKRKDFKEMVIHHVATMVLVYFSWVINFVRVGTLIFVIHDASDHWMAAAKMAKYCKRQMLCEFLFFTFLAIWVVCRLIFFPFWVLHTTYVELWTEISGLGYAFYMFNGLLFVLQILHIIWSYFIVRVLVQKIRCGKVQKDTRSDTESDDGQSDEAGDSNRVSNHVSNGSLNSLQHRNINTAKTK